MNEEPDAYHAYLLRLRRVLCQGEWQWRASLESPHTGEHQSFASLEQCLTYLVEQFGSQVGNQPEDGKEAQAKPLANSNHSTSPKKGEKDERPAIET